MKYLPFILLSTLLVGCMTAKLSGTGINAQSPEYGDFSANSINAELDLNADD